MALLEEMEKESIEPGEVLFLRFFFDKAGRAMGPADHDIYCMIMEDFELRYGQQVPAKYREGYLTEEEGE